MQQEKQQHEKFGGDFRESINNVFLIASIHAMCFMPFLRCDFGTCVPGFIGIGSLILLVLMTGSGDPAMTNFLLLWLLALVYQRCRTSWLFSTGWRNHSQSWGRPWFAMLIPFVRTESAGKNIEPFLCLFAGGLLSPLSETLGKFVIVGTVSLLVVRRMQMETMRRQLTAFQDLEIEQRAMSERVRGLRDDF